MTNAGASGRRRRALAVVAMAAAVSWSLALTTVSGEPAGFVWNLPPGFPEPKVPEDNPMTVAKVELGRHLFYDTRLSIDNTFSCATCHQQARAFADDKGRGVGVTGEVHPRGPMSLTNVAYSPVLTWANPTVRRLEIQALRALTASARRGEELFFSETTECFHCHGGFNFTQTVDYVKKGFSEIEFHNNGLSNVDGKGGYPPRNTGVHAITDEPDDMGRFKAPTLRNIAVTAPYMHDGSLQTLAEVIAHYEAGGRTVTTGPYQGIGAASPLKSSFVKGFTLTALQRRDLIAFSKA